MLHATQHIVDIALIVLPALFAAMILHDFVLYVKAQQRGRRVPGKPQPIPTPATPEVIKPEPIAAPVEPIQAPIEQPQQPAPIAELQGPALPDLSTLKIYKLHSHAVVLTSDLPTPPPAQVKLYKLRGKECLRLKDLEARA